MWCGEVQLGTKCMHTYVHIIIYIYYSVIIFITVLTGNVHTYVRAKVPSSGSHFAVKFL